MAQTKISEGQNLLDVAIQELGSVAAAFDLADAAGLAITDALTPGQVLTVPTSTAGVPDVVKYLRTRSKRINTGSPIKQAPPIYQFDFDASDFNYPDFQAGYNL